MNLRSFLCVCLMLSTSVPSLLNGQEAWQALFDGKSLDGWTVKSGFATYRVEDHGIIVGTTAEGSGNTFLCTENEYGDFELEFEVKVDDSLNSGGRVFGPQVEIESSPGQAGYVYGEATGRGWLSVEPQSEDAEVNQHELIKNGEWNKYRVVADGPTIRVWINGVSVCELTDEEIYKTHPKGFIGLQVHGIGKGAGPYEVRWRNLRVKQK